MALEAGTRLGHYEVVSSLGAGGVGEVYRAKDTHLGREVAIKLLLDEVSADPEEKWSNLVVRRESRRFSVGAIPTRELVVPPGSNRSGGGGNESAEAFGAEGHER